MTGTIRTVELVGWGLDEYPFRPPLSDPGRLAAAKAVVALREPFGGGDPLCVQETELLQDAFDRQRERSDLQAEMRGLDWSLGVIDLRGLLAFQRRLSFRTAPTDPPLPAQSDWSGLMRLAFAPQAPLVCEMHHDTVAHTVTLSSRNPNLHLRVTGDAAVPLHVHPGSPFLEVANYRGRWFLRDGYHRAALLLRADIVQVPAVIVRARSLDELGATEPWFFPESVLLSVHAPRVCDFLDSQLTVEYTRPATVKTLRLTIEEVLTSKPLTIEGEYA